MTTKEFVGYFKMTKDKKVECEKRINKTYIPFINKIAECTRIVKATMEMKQDDISVFMQNTPARYLIFNMTMIEKYTDIQFDTDNSLYEEYDLLNECGAFDVLISCIPEHEYKEFSTLLSMTLDDYVANERELTSYIDRRMDALMQLALTNKEQDGVIQNG